MPLRLSFLLIIIMYSYHALINGLIHINLNMIFYTHVEHNPTKTIYIKCYTKTKTKKSLQTHTHPADPSFENDAAYSVPVNSNIL